MSKTQIYPIPCPKCKVITEQEIYHTINTNMTESAVNKILSDEINFVICKSCKNKFQVKASLFFIDFAKRYCFHYYPNPKNENIMDNILSNIKKMFGNDFFLGHPIVFLDWEIFKKEIAKMEDISIGLNGKTKETKIEMYERHLRKDRGIYNNRRSWSCNICDGDETTGCLFYDPTECPKFS
ncbi:MAG: CpXC domain-containing protein [Bacteroidetes bacterium]|nr:CpXC domain-containing protein [Bacteroidota bacterium]